MSNTDTCTISTSKSFTGSVKYRVIDEKSDVACLSQQIMEEREERSLHKEDALFIAVAWIVKPAFRLFKYVRKLFGSMSHHTLIIRGFISLHSHLDYPLASKLFGCGFLYRTNRGSVFDGCSRRLYLALFQSG